MLRLAFLAFKDIENSFLEAAIYIKDRKTYLVFLSCIIGLISIRTSTAIFLLVLSAFVIEFQVVWIAVHQEKQEKYEKEFDLNFKKPGVHVWPVILAYILCSIAIGSVT